MGPASSLILPSTLTLLEVPKDEIQEAVEKEQKAYKLTLDFTHTKGLSDLRIGDATDSIPVTTWLASDSPQADA